MTDDFDMGKAIVPKSDQLNADDLLAGPITIKIRKMEVRGDGEQKVSVYYEGDNNKPFKPCKSMCRVMVLAWGKDAKQYVGKSMTLYNDPTVKWGGLEVGGIRISHMSDIGAKRTMVLTMTKGSKKPFAVQPLVEQKGPTLQDMLHDIANAPALVGLEYKFKEAAKAFTDEKSRAALIAAKDKRKLELAELPVANQKPKDAIEELTDPNGTETNLTMMAG